MEFTSNDRVTLLKLYGAKDGDSESTSRAMKELATDYRQLEMAADKTVYELITPVRNSFGEPKTKKITRTGAIRLLGREMWLSGLVRSAFHWDSMRYLDDGRMVSFDSRELFK